MKQLLLSLFLLLGTQISFAQNLDYEWGFDASVASNSIHPYVEFYHASFCSDAQGNTYLLGTFKDSIDIDPGIGQNYLYSNGFSDIYLQKIDPTGNLVWAKQIGAVGNDHATTISIDNLGHLYISGLFSDTVDFDPSMSTQTMVSTGTFPDMFIEKFDTSGNMLWAKQLSGPRSNGITQLKVDQQGNPIIVGFFRDSVDFDPAVATTNSITSFSDDDIFILKLNTAGNFVWVKRLGGSHIDFASDMALDANDNIYLTGQFHSGDFDADPGTGSHLLQANGITDVFVEKLDPSGNLLWVKEIGSASAIYSNAIALDPSGNIYITGHFLSSVGFNPGVASDSLHSNGQRDVFIEKLDPSGNFIWVKQIGGVWDDKPQDLVLDDYGNIYLAASFSNTIDCDPGVGVQSFTSLGGTDLLYLKLDALGDYVWAFQMGGTGVDNTVGIKPLGRTGLYLMGVYAGTMDLDPTTGVTMVSSTSPKSIFGVKLSRCGGFMDTLSVSGNTLSSGVLNVSYQWLDCDNAFAPITGATAQSFSATENGNYAVVVNENGCIDTSACAAITTVNLQTIENKEEIQVYPNPTTGDFTIDLGASAAELTVDIYNIQGQLLESKIFLQQNKILLNLNYPAGVYLLKIRKGGVRIPTVLKLIKN